MRFCVKLSFSDIYAKKLSNTYFQFKQFRIEQSRCSMKVCTDACVQGAYAADWLTQSNKDMKRILDIGTGTGLLALMLAQKNPSVHFDAIELNQQAYLQAKENFIRSPWSGNISVVQGDIKTAEIHPRYDFIICNPPFYENEMKSDKPHKNQSKHSSALSHRELRDSITRYLTENGTACIMLPRKQFDWFNQLMVNDNFSVRYLLRVRQTPAHPCFRMIGFFNKNITSTVTEELCICQTDQEYSREFKALLKDYYLYL
ncbi:MAG: methyltransferase domain-containing protein [Chitinophagaceae bacterium]|nr:MAG: methyltransferase domain-containing protein [Chitinophagaceae bacterium]